MKNVNKAIGLMICIIVVCVGISTALLLKYFYFGVDSKYGDRLDGIEEVLITDDRIEKLDEMIREDSTIEDSQILVTGKIIYIRMAFNKSGTLTDGQNLAVKVLNEFSDKEKDFYDFQFTLVQSESDDTDGFLIMGSMNANGTKLEWNNNNKTEEEE
jgi:hypothetical protein